MKISLSLFMTFLVAVSAAAGDHCSKSEWDVEQKAIFKQSHWEEAMTHWESVEPRQPGLIVLLKAYNIYKAELSNSKKLKGDKRRLCYMGCKITQQTSYQVAEYVAWYKEYDDLSDCDRKTLFEEVDYLYTIEGAEIGKESPEDSTICMDSCSTMSRKLF